MEIQDPPDTRKRRPYLRYVVLLLVVVVAVGFSIFRLVRPSARATPSNACSDTTGPAGPQAALSPFRTATGMECVGWIVDHDEPFGSTDPKVNAVITKIVAENVRVRDEASAGGEPYVRIAVFMPMTSSPTSAMSGDEVFHALQGAFAAQFEANLGRSAALRGKTPRFQLVLANEGTDHSAYAKVVDQLGELKTGPHPLVAVTGMSISTPETKLAGQRLSELGLPSISAIVTADDMVAPAMFKVSPSNRQYAAALKAYLDGQQPLKNGFLVWDRNAGDNYVQQLKLALLESFGADYGLVDHNRAFNGTKPPSVGTAQLFSNIVDNICEAESQLVFYSGRDRDLSGFIEALEGRTRCRPNAKKTPIIVATGATGLTLDAKKLDADLVGVVNASSTDSVGWTRNIPGTPYDFANFRKLFTAKGPLGLGYPDSDLASGYAIMHRDAVVAAVWAARLAAAAKSDSNNGRDVSMPTAEDVRDSLFTSPQTRIPGASGSMYFKEEPKNDLWPIDKPVPVIRVGAVTRSWPTLPAWKTSLVPAS
jgi:ABC-type branched-subunit amino acid transport system substrate-binding protein